MDAIPCPWCKAEFEDIDGPVHRYLESSPGCWAAYGQVLAREYSELGYSGNHRLTVDAYAAQHPGQPSPQSVQSVAVHLLSLYLVLERGIDQTQATRQMARIAKSKQLFHWLEPPDDLGTITVKDILDTSCARDHASAVVDWARAVWTAWQEQHATVREWSSRIV